MNEAKMLSAKPVQIKVTEPNENDGIDSYRADVNLSDIRKDKTEYSIIYYTPLYWIRTIYKKTYVVSEEDNKRIIESINSGLKFVAVGEDIINVGQIKCIEKKRKEIKTFQAFYKDGVLMAIKEDNAKIRRIDEAIKNNDVDEFNEIIKEA